jgi:pimeloyl-ACP methyl ester carboxylesterase
MTLLGHEQVGTGPVHVIVTNDWLSDTTSWDHARAYFDLARFTYALADLRGYGLSRHLPGPFGIRESADDLRALADHLGWPRFGVVAHSMSTLIAMDLAQHHPDRVERMVLVTPAPPRGFPPDPARLAAIRAIALADDTGRVAYFTQRFDQRLSPGWAAYKAARWRATAEPAAAADYTHMFARDGLAEPALPIEMPVLAIFGERDAQPLRRDAVEPALHAIAPRLEVIELADVGHYPMQEMPPKTVALVERFLGAD